RLGPRGDQGRRLRRGVLHLVEHRAQPGRHRGQAARQDGRRGDRPRHRRQRPGVRPAGRRAARDRGRRAAGRRARRVRRRAPGRAGGGRQVTPPSPARPFARGRRLRSTPALRRLTAQTRLAPADFVLPVFVKQGIDAPVSISSMPGVVQHTLDSLRKAAHEAAEAGIGGLMLFGIPGEKDAIGSQADAADGIVNVALRQLRSDLGDELVLMADLCLCEYTDHGHCGIVTPAGLVDNDPTLDRYAAVAIAQAQAGAHVIAPSGMMDGQVAAIRNALDGSGFSETPILAYAAKYASGFYGPFREAAEGALQFGDRSTYQMDPP